MRQEVLSYLRSVKTLYPGGLPRSVPIQQKSEIPTVVKPATLPTFAVAFVWADSTFPAHTDPWADEQGRFLRSAVQKGMKLPDEAVTLVRGPVEELSARIVLVQAQIFVVLGFKNQLASTFPDLSEDGVVVSRSAAQGKTLLTLSVAEASSSGELKRLFWSHLKTVLDYLAVAPNL